MTPDRSARLKELRGRLTNLTEEERKALTSRALIATVEGHVLSPANTMLVYLQSNGVTPTVVGGYQQWRKAGRQVSKGQHGFTIWFPVGSKNGNGDVEDVETFYTATVFDISQTEEV